AVLARQVRPRADRRDRQLDEMGVHLRGGRRGRRPRSGGSPAPRVGRPDVEADEPPGPLERAGRPEARPLALAALKGGSHHMPSVLASRIMPRTPVNVDPSVLRALKPRSRREGKSIGQLISELVAQQLADEETGEGTAGGFEWASQPMKARTDLEDKEALRAVLDRR